MLNYDTPKNVCIALSTFIIEIREQTAALRAYDNVFQNKSCDSIFMKRAQESIWRELLSEIARIFDKVKTGSSDNCTLLRLKELCCKEPYLSLFFAGSEYILIESLTTVIEQYYLLPIKRARNKQLAHHDLKQVLEGECIEVSLEQVEKLIEDVVDVFEKIYSRFYYGIYEISFINYDVLVKQFEKDIQELL